MKIYRTAQLNEDRDLSRTDLSFLRRMSESIAKMETSLNKVPDKLDPQKLVTAINQMTSKLGDINNSIKDLKSALKK